MVSSLSECFGKGSSFLIDATFARISRLAQVQELYWKEMIPTASIPFIMISYGQYCPVARAAELLNERWTLLIMRDLLGGAQRFNDIRRGVPRMSPSLLSKRLKDLEAAGLIVRRNRGESGIVEYFPTPAGLEVQPIVEFYGVWGQRWVRGKLDEDELDVSLLMWFLRCGIDRRFFPSERTVIQFEFTDRPRLRKENWWLDQWWLVVTRDEVDLCIHDPGHEVDLYVVSDLRTLTKVSMGDIRLRKALRDQSIEVHGSRSLVKSLKDWLPRSPFASVPKPPRALDIGSIIESIGRNSS
jgi:DNA-binding HxlR family transcriptional regulator